MLTHLGLLALFAVFASIVFAVLMRDDPHEQLRFGIRLLVAFISAALVLAWLMYPLPL